MRLLSLNLIVLSSMRDSGRCTLQSVLRTKRVMTSYCPLRNRKTDMSQAKGQHVASVVRLISCLALQTMLIASTQTPSMRTLQCNLEPAECHCTPTTQMLTHPPSIFKWPPVINLLSSLAKNATTLATSSGCPNRPKAVSDSSSARFSLLQPSLNPGVAIMLV